MNVAAVQDLLNTDFLKIVLTNAFQDASISIKNTDISIATAAGDNYSSKMYRVKIQYSTDQASSKTVAVIVKQISDFTHLNQLKFHEREVEMYTSTMPAMSVLANGEFFCARCLYESTTPDKIMIFQDLCEVNYRMADRKHGLDYEHSRLVMVKLGKFHASSMVLVDKNAHSMASYSFGMFNEATRSPDSFCNKFFSNGLATLIESVVSWPGYEAIALKLQKIQLNFINRMFQEVATNNDSIRVLNHGDLWINNILFQYRQDGANEVPEKVVFVDYQMSFYSSPAIDIHYYLNTSPNTDVLVNRSDDLIQAYYSSLHEALTEMKAVNIPSFEEIKADIYRKEFYGFMASVAILPLVLMDKQTTNSDGIGSLIDEKESAKIREITYSGEKYQTTMKYLLQRFEKLEVLD